MNNMVYTGNRTYGFRCYTCGGIFDRMWAETLMDAEKAIKDHAKKHFLTWDSEEHMLQRAARIVNGLKEKP